MPTTTTPIPASPPAAPAFTDRHGVTHRLVSGHRDRLKPGWRRMLLPQPPPPTDAELAAEMTGLAERLELAARILSAFSTGFAGRKVLAVGCGDSAEPGMIAARGAARVVGIDRTLSADSDLAQRIAAAIARMHPHADRDSAQRGPVELRTADITATSLPDESFDLACSWRTLEHVVQPAAALREMYRLLRPGGVAYHEYNPFFGLDGGHSLVTLDVPWGHVRLDREDIGRYLRAFRPAEREKALAYYDQSLNRMTIGDFEHMALDAGFEILALVPRTRTEDLMEVDAELLRAARRNYPRITVNDLVCRIVRAVLRKPDRDGKP